MTEVIYAQPYNPNPPLQICEPSEGLTVGILPTAQAIFRGRGEAIPISDEEVKEPQVGNQEVEELFEEAANLHPRKMMRFIRRNPTLFQNLNITPSPPQSPEMVRLSMMNLLGQDDEVDPLTPPSTQAGGSSAE